MTNHQTFIVVIAGQEDEVLQKLQANFDVFGVANAPPRALGPEAIFASSWPSSLNVLKLPSLTARQQQILPLLLDGLSNKRIARILGLSHFTVRNHITCIYNILGVGGRRALAGMFSQVTPPDLKVAA
jgi:DNA-binding CsgD family transcriptional regulator